MRNIYIKLTVLVSVLLMVCLCSCSTITSDKPEGAYFAFSFPESPVIAQNESRSSRAPVPSNVVQYQIQLEGNDEIVNKTAVPGSSVYIDNLRICTYKIKISALDASGNCVAVGTKEAVPLPNDIDKKQIVEWAGKFGYSITESELENHISIRLTAVN